MWDFLLWLLPDGQVGTFEVKDWLNVGLALVAVRLAILANRISQKQDAIADAVRAKTASLTMRDTSQAVSGQHVLVPFEVLNTGSKGASGFHWELYLDHAAFPNVCVVDANNRTVHPVAGVLMSGGAPWDQYDAFNPTVLFPKSALMVTRVRAFNTVTNFEVRFRVRYDDGTEPSEGFKAIRFDKGQGGFYNPTALADAHQA